MGYNLLYVLKSFLKKSNVRIDFDELEIQFLSHPSYPSLHALTGVLNHFNIENAAIRLPVNKDVLKELPEYFIAQVNYNNAPQLALVHKEEESFKVTYSEKKQESLNKKQFLENFTGVVSIIENDITNKPEAIINNNKHYLLASAFLFIILYQYFYGISNLTSFLYILLAIFGVIVSYAIFKQEQGETTIINSTLCNISNEKKDCDSVLNSKGATLFKTIKLSDISMVYFLASSISIFMLKASGFSLSVNYLISLLALPVTVYSIYYQKFIIKKWCALCLTIVTILWLQAGLLITNNLLYFDIPIQSILAIIASYSIAIFIWNFTSNAKKSNIDFNKLKIDYLKFKKNFGLFSLAIQNSETVNTFIPDFQEMSFGNKESNLKIVIVTNPYCGHCKSVHKLISKILDLHKDDVEIKIRFNINTNDKGAQAVNVTGRLLELYFSKGRNESLSAMHDIYGDVNTEDWLKKWGNCENLDYFYDILLQSREWCNESNLNFTPALLINEKMYPKEYSRDDLIYFIEELEENSTDNLILQKA
ncbi:vitamin K epoxide reductase family protein [Winogradskyella sp. SYSU M77433]|uniref:vitamin K epoxide reductase family protein n=1 Tax=Winogradskyella sp. SYSU M77433 TaxID=3042722 RepID=UPI00247FBCB6|nr:vitamin K epoxide reductase family protein [Winogradskyella sp. SYSU M77433]MDH7914575.1 vitamin K epoxide reductase family protein [Winogradskyella sp. SYSU M77433]